MGARLIIYRPIVGLPATGQWIQLRGVYPDFTVPSGPRCTADSLHIYTSPRIRLAILTPPDPHHLVHWYNHPNNHMTRHPTVTSTTDKKNPTIVKHQHGGSVKRSTSCHSRSNDQTAVGILDFRVPNGNEGPAKKNALCRIGDLINGGQSIHHSMPAPEPET